MPYLEPSELEGGVTIRKMQEVAEAMGCKFVYAMVPEENIESLLEQQALKKSTNIIISGIATNDAR